MDKKFTSVVCSGSHSLALSTEGKLYGWGDTSFNCLGKDFKSTRFLSIPEKIPNNRFFQGLRESNQASTNLHHQEIPCEFQFLALNELFSLIVVNNVLFSFGKEATGYCY